MKKCNYFNVCRLFRAFISLLYSFFFQGNSIDYNNQKFKFHKKFHTKIPCVSYNICYFSEGKLRLCDCLLCYTWKVYCCDQIKISRLSFLKSLYIRLLPFKTTFFEQLVFYYVQVIVKIFVSEYFVLKLSTIEQFI
jgi:hypothetical protein